MREAGVVISCDGTRAEVTVLRHSACGENCASCKGGCAPTKTVITAENTAGAKPGDKVLMEMSDKKALGAAAIVYILPLVLMLAAAVIVYASGGGEELTALCSVCALGMGFLLAHLISRIYGKKFGVKIISVISGG